MPRFAANLSMLYSDRPFLDRFESAARDGFSAVECLFPYDFEAFELRARLRDHGLEWALFNAPPGGIAAEQIAAQWKAGSHGTACLVGREAEFRWGVDLALRTASALGCRRVHCMAGVLSVGADRTAARALYVRNLRWAAEQAANAGCDILIEPINPRDMPGYFLNTQADAHAIVQEVGAANLKVQMDLYHCQIVEGDVETKIRRYLPTGRVGHFQIAGVPQRHEPDAGELDVPYLLGVIDEVATTCGWQGWVGCEYRPRDATAEGTTRGLGWMRSWPQR